MDPINKFSKPGHRRKFIKELGAGLSGILLSPHVFGRGNPSQAQTELVFSFGSEDTDTISKLVDNFNNQYQGRIQVKWKKRARSSDVHYNQLKSDFTVESDDFDGLGADVPWTAAFAKNGWVLDISRRFFNTFSANDFLESSLNSVSYRYRVWGVPWYTNAGMLFYRKDLLQENDYQKPPQTWDELKDMAQKVIRSSGTKYGYVFQGAEYEGGVANALEYIWNSGGRVLTGNISVAGAFGQSIIDPNVITVNSEDASRGLNIARSMIEEGIAPERVMDFKELETTTSFIEGEAVFMRNWPEAYGLISNPRRSKISPEQVGVSLMPGDTSTRRRFSCLGGWNLMINSNIDDDKIDAAWTFIKFLTAPEQQRFMSLNAGFLPTYRSLYDDNDLVVEKPVISLGKEAIKNTRVRPVTPFYDQISPRIARAFNQTLRGNMTGGQAVQKLETELQTILRKNR